jgi:1-pyrroline-4-hydroxy-2-carboxylate deaminase
MSVNWHGVIPALTTPFDEEFGVDHGRLARHATALAEEGCVGVVAAGSLGEAATLTDFEKVDVVRTLVGALGNRTPVVAGVAAPSTAQAVTFARDVAAADAAALMVLPPYVYVGDERETLAHVGAVIAATDLPCMLDNDPVAYAADFRPDHLARLAEAHPNLVAVKESSKDVRRVAAIRALLGDRIEVLVGGDDAIVEGVAAGASGWIAGLANAFPRESVALFELARRGQTARAAELYRWFLPLPRLGTMPKLVQLIKLVQELVGFGHHRVRPPRLALAAAERQEVEALVERALAERPDVDAWWNASD